MSRKARTPEEQARRDKIRALLQESHIRDIYGLSVSDTTLSRITDKILPIAKEWQKSPLENLYAVVFMDAIHYHVRSEGQMDRPPPRLEHHPCPTGRLF